MALFGGLFNKSSKTNYQTTNQYADSSANAAEGSLAVGSGASVNITTTDAELAKTAVQTNAGLALGTVQTMAGLSGAALGTVERTAGAALETNRDVSTAALLTSRDINLASLETNAALATHAVNTISGVNEIAARERIDTLTTTNTALQSQQGAINQFADLASGALERSQTPDSQVTKTLLYVVGAVAALFVLMLFRTNRRKS